MTVSPEDGDAAQVKTERNGLQTFFKSVIYL